MNVAFFGGCQRLSLYFFVHCLDTFYIDTALVLLLNTKPKLNF